METVRDTKLGRTRHAIKSALEVAATIMVIVASGAVIASTTMNWRTKDNTSSPNERSLDRPPPTTPHALDGATLLGNRDAKVAIVQYSDFECPFCKQFAHDTWPELKKRYVDSGKVLAAFRHLPLTSHQYARQAAVSANCAGQQGKFWEMHDRLFEQQTTLAAETTNALASEIGLDINAFEACVRQSSTSDLSADQGYAAKSGIQGTPTFLIGVIAPDKTVKVTSVIVGARSLDQFTTALDELLADHGRWTWSWFRRPF